LSALALRYLSLAEVLELHRRIVAVTGGPTALRDLGALESAVAQPRASFAGEDLYPDLASKATALAFSLINNHPFVDGNKRVAYACLELFLQLNGLDVSATNDDTQTFIYRHLEAGTFRKDALETWLRANTTPFKFDD